MYLSTRKVQRRYVFWNQHLFNCEEFMTLFFSLSALMSCDDSISDTAKSSDTSVRETDEEEVSSF